jgi:16S rRNA (cytidine1402-2'-O)-methyltransferase
VLYVVATPIGNLEDLTYRAVRILGEVSIVAAEDTRRTARLLKHYGIQTPTLSFHEHNEHQKAPRLLTVLEQGQSIALVSDAGTPLLSDPGGGLVKAAIDLGIQVTPVPGASAVLAALVMSGLTGNRFTFVGFPPNRSLARKKWLKALPLEQGPLVIFEAPHRLLGSLTDMLEIIGDIEVAVCRELTKIHEELVVGPISSALSQFPQPRGEFTLVIYPRAEEKKAPSTQAILDEFGRLTNLTPTRRAAVTHIARKYGLSARSVYKMLEEGKR